MTDNHDSSELTLDRATAQGPLPPGCPRGLTNDRLALLGTLAGLVVALVYSFVADGFYHDDDICHFLYARDAWADPGARWHWWARAGYTLPAMVVAQFTGLVGCRVFSAVQTAIVAWLAYGIARRIGDGSPAQQRLAALAPLAVWAQPLVLLLAHTTLTETPAMLYLSLAVWLYLRGRRVHACAWMSLVLVTRVETAALVPVLAMVMLHDAWRQGGRSLSGVARTPWLWAGAAVLAWAPLAWVLGAWLAQLPLEEGPLGIFSRPYSAQYGSGGWGHFLTVWMAEGGLAIAILALAGAVGAGRRGLLVSGLGLGLLALHTVLFRYGLFATGGYARFLMAGAGLYGALAAVGVAVVWKARPAWLLCGWLALAAVWVPTAADLLPHFPIWPVSVAGLTVVTLALLGIAMRGRGWAGLRDRLGPTAVGACMLLAGVQLAVQGRPLTMACSEDAFYCNLHHLVRDATLDLAQGYPADAHPGLTTHVLAPLMRDGVRLAANPTDAAEKWRAAQPGTLFVWDSKYGREPEEDPAGSALYAQLTRLGSSVTQREHQGNRVEVFLRRTDD